jgi:dienelactone hydrolase
MADENPFNLLIREQARKLRANDQPPKSREEWDARRKSLLNHIAAAVGPVPAKPCDLEPRIVGTIDRDGYRIEKLIFQSRPDVWVTATAYVPAVKEGQKVPAVLVVHGHWAWARRDPVVQARCLGLVKLGFFVLAVDAFGAGDRYTNPARGTYHGALYGSTLWPVGHTLLGMQIYDNRRAVDYLLTRKEVDGKFGVTGASGGGNQSMYAGALDDRFQAVVPVCSVGNYQAYLQAACCVCEVLPGALKFTEEGDVLGLIARRALLVMNASRDGIQFSPAEAEKSMTRAKAIFKLFGEEAKARHVIFDSGHDYNRSMREAMYGWMTLHLKGEGRGEPIPEPEHAVEKPEDLACFPNPSDRPKGFLTPPLFAGKVGKELVAAADRLAPTHPEMWEATANAMRESLRSVIGLVEVPKDPRLEPGVRAGSEVRTGSGTVEVEPGLKIPCTITVPGLAVKFEAGSLVLDLKGAAAPSWYDGLVARWGKAEYRLGLSLRGTGAQLPKAGAIAGAPDHTMAEHGVWIGRSLLGQWTVDAVGSIRVLRKMVGQKSPLAVLGNGPATVVAVCASAISDDAQLSTVLADVMTSWATELPYQSGTFMGLLVPGVLKVGDIPHLAALIAPRRLIIAGGVSPQGQKLTQKELEEAFRFTAGVYKTLKAADKLTIAAEPDWKTIKF